MAGWSWELVGREVAALGAIAASWPLRFVSRRAWFDPTAPHAVPVMLVHGFLGDASNLLAIRAHLTARGAPNFATFDYGPSLEHERLALGLRDAIDGVRAATGAERVDVIGHSLGGLVARRVIEQDGGLRIRRLVSLGAPYFARPLPANELAIFAANDPFVPRPSAAWGTPRITVLPECGHWGLLFHPEALDHATRFLLASEVRRAPAVVRPIRLVGAPPGPAAARG